MFGHTPAASPPPCAQQRTQRHAPRLRRPRGFRPGGGAPVPAPGARPSLAARSTLFVRAAPFQCPSCEVEVTADSAAFPFCSKRCRLLDLDRWVSGKYVVSRPLDARDVEELEATLEGREPSSRHVGAEGEDHDDDEGDEA